MTDRLDLRVLGEEDWELLRQLRLKALAHDPAAFASTFASEQRFTEAQWRALVTGWTWFLAAYGSAHAGIAAGTALYVDSVDERHLLGLWVDPQWRRRGVAHALVEAVTDWAVRDGGRWLSLWVADDNMPARALYATLGFRATDRVQPVPSAPHRTETLHLKEISGREATGAG
ncbi:MAG: GNAT family N-acetyltransferase [Frankia sp.]|nr:GNAT family N-acetyltransferase [Frankia sp.]